MELDSMIKLIQTVSVSAITEFSLEQGETKICLKKNKTAQQTVAVPTEIPQQIVTEGVEEGNFIKSPLVGRFYVAPAEDADAFVTVGDSVKKGQVVAIVEAMKLMNDIESEYEGVVAEVLVQNGETVEYGQPLFRIVQEV